MTLTKLILASALVVTTVAAVPTYSFAITCRELCTEFMPKPSMTDPGNYDCQDQIDQNAVNCTIGGKRNAAHNEPNLGDYNRDRNGNGNGGRYRSYQ